VQETRTGEHKFHVRINLQAHGDVLIFLRILVAAELSRAHGFLLVHFPFQ